MKKSDSGWVVLYVAHHDGLYHGAPCDKEWFPTFEEAEAALELDLREFEAQGRDEKFLIVPGYLYQSERNKWQEHKRIERIYDQTT